MPFLDLEGLQILWSNILSKLSNKVDTVEGKQLSTNDFTNEEKSKLASLAQSNWAASENEPGHVLNRTHYDAVMTKTLYNGTIIATAGTLTRINSIPDEMIINYPDVSVVKAIFDGKACTITATTNKWELRDPNGQLVFTMNYDTAKGAQCLVSTYAGSGAHTLVIEVDEITAVPLDEKYIPNTIPRRVDIPHMAMPDWGAAEGEAGYVKNRTHYEEKHVIVPNTIVNVPSSELYAALPKLNTTLIVGSQYAIGFNNENYICTAWKDGDVIYLGNGNIYPGVNKGENVPFSIDTYADDTAYLNTQVGGEYVVSIGTPGTIKQLDEKFIPDSIARENSVAERFNNLFIPDKLADLAEDATHRVVTDTEKETWNAKSDFSGDYNDLINKPTIPSIEGLASETYVNNAVSGLASENYVQQSIKDFTTETYVNNIVNGLASETYVQNAVKDLVTGNYVDNAIAALVDSSPETLNTLNELAAALGDDPNFATTVVTQIGEIETALDNKVEKVSGKSLSTNDFTNDEKNLLATIGSDYLTSTDKAELAAHANNKGKSYSRGLYKIATNAEGHVTDAVAITKEDITAYGIPGQDTTYEAISDEEIDAICGTVITHISEVSW